MPDVRTSDQRTTRRGPNPETLRLAREESIVEARPSIDTPSADEMFLSPRVLDAGAFSRYAEMLKSLIGDARSGARDLQDFAADADEMTAKCQRSGDQLKARLEAGARIIKLVDERADRAERLLEAARDTLPTAENLRSQIEPAVQAAVDAAEARAEQVATGAEQRIRSAAADVERRLAAMTIRAAEQAERLENAGDAIDTRISSLEARLSQLSQQSEQRTAEHESRAKAAVDAAHAELEPVLRRAADATSTIDETLDRARHNAETRADEIAERIGPLQSACDAVLDRLGLSQDNDDPAASVLNRLETLVQRSEKSMQGADRVLSQVETLTLQANDVRSRFGMWLLEAATQLDVLEARREQLEGPLSKASEKINRISPHLTNDLEQASLKLDQLQTEQSILREAIGASMTLAQQSGEKLNNQAAQMRALIDGSMHHLTQRVEEAGIWLGQLITRAESIHGQPSTFEQSHQEPTPQDSLPEPRHHSSASFDAAPSPIEPAHAFFNDPQPELEQQAHPEPALPAPITQPEPEAKTMSNTPNVQTSRPVEVEPIRSYDLPSPPQLPIDAVNFEGAQIVYGQSDGDDANTQAAD
ncbi:MAG: hypothetical protein AB8F26_10795 [Phycisphaerales bacterium]